jgi:predicted phosphohydrolase
MNSQFTRRSCLVIVVVAMIASSSRAQTTVDSGFSFAAYGDSRTMMYLPPKDGQPDLTKLFVEMFGLVLPERVAEEVVKKDVKLIFDPTSKELIRIIMPFMSRSEVMTLTVDKGWVTEASVEDVKLLPGVHREMFRLDGGDWVSREIVKDVQSGRARFVVSSGDLVWWGNQGRTVADSPYWKRLNDTMLKQLPPADAEMKAAGLNARWFVSPGNHEVWGDPKIEGVLNAVPWLKDFGVTPENLIYKFDFNGVRFIYLWSGKYDYRSPSLWDGDRPKYAEQMTHLQRWLDEAKSQGIKKAFIVFHYPVFARSGLGPIPAETNPHKVIASYAKDMELVVFNGHVHTTEMFDVDGVKYLMMGGGGAEQDPILPGRTSIKTLPADYPPELYWKGQPPQEEYNYVLVDVKPGENTKFTLNRFRPGSAEPFASVELFK